VGTIPKHLKTLRNDSLWKKENFIRVFFSSCLLPLFFQLNLQKTFFHNFLCCEYLRNEKFLLSFLYLYEKAVLKSLDVDELLACYFSTKHDDIIELQLLDQ
jgi:hypothetical protein